MRKKYCHNCCREFRRSRNCPYCDSEQWDYSDALIADANRDMFEDDYPYDDFGDK